MSQLYYHSFQLLSGSVPLINEYYINSRQKGAVNFTDQELLILNMLKRRLFTPVAVIVKVLFDGNSESATESIRILVERKMLEYAVNNRITITTAGMMSIRKQTASRHGINW
jgi:hypothetical protein